MRREMWIGLAVVLIGLAAAPREACAVEEGWAFSGGVVGASIPTQDNGILGVGAVLRARYGLTDSLNLRFGALYSYHFDFSSEDEALGGLQVGIPHVGVTYALDIIDIIPYVSLDLTAYLANDAFFDQAGGGPVGVGLMAGIGLEYRPWREWSIGVEGGYHAFLLDLGQYPVYIHLDLHATFHYEPF